MNDNTELLTWAVENITEWNDDYTHLRSDCSASTPLFYTKGGGWVVYEPGTWFGEKRGDEYTAQRFDDTDFSTKTPQVITKQDWEAALAATHTDSSSCKPLQGHIHANLMAEYAEVALTNPEPWKEFEYLCGYYKDGEEVDIWEPCLADLCFRAEVKYRRKPTPPKTMNIGGIVVEAWPLGVGDSCTRLHTVRLNCNGYYVRSADANGKSLAILLSSGKAFSTKEQAQAVADALNKLYNDALVGWKQQ